MPGQSQILHQRDVHRYAAEQCFSAGVDRVGAEIEFLTFPVADPLGYCDFDSVRRATDAALPGGSRITFEPGGQIELSSAVFDDLPGVLAGLDRDLSVVARALDAAGVRLVGSGADQMRAERRVLFAPRYDAMEAFFDADGLSGRAMMCRTAAIQINLDFGPDATEARARWRRAHALGPVMAAAFANSPMWCGAPSGWKSTRLATWSGIDRTRTVPVGGEGASDWARYMLDARVMLIRRSDDDFVPILDRLTFGDWINRGHAFGWPALDDLAYHASTLFPPIRPRGWMELRMCDALPDPWWKVPVMAWTALLYGPAIIDPETGSLWREAARSGLEHPLLQQEAMRAFAAAIDALDALPSFGVDPSLVVEYVDRYVARGRTPADDTLDGVGKVDISREPAWI
jgi:glutamate--cysteine ligase